MIERQIEIATKDGAMNTFVVHPERHGPNPVILLYMDAPGIREELRDMARRIATVGYYVMLPNLYYRSGVEELGAFIGEAAADTRKRMFALMASLTIPLVMDDTDALIAVADADPAAARGPMGTVGYCMSGRYALSAAVRHPDRVTAAASIYGVNLITDQPDSPHLTLRSSKAAIYVAWAEIDHYAPLDQLEPLRIAFTKAGLDAEIELYPKAEHGFAFPQRPAYDKAAAEHHWERLFALFGKLRP
jgi:carboxymethylenebutenolidase